MSNTNKAIKPKWSLYDTQNNPEHELFENYIVEFTDIAGVEVDYYIRRENDINSDRLYGEPLYQNTVYHVPLRTKLVHEPSEEPTLTTPFGIQSEDIVQYAHIPKFTFSRDVSASYHPKPGDVMKILWNNRNYEVIDVHEEEQIFQLKKFTWQFVLRAYRFSEQSDSARDITNFTRQPTSDDTVTDTTITPLSAFGDNKFIEEESDNIDTYSDVDTSIYGY